MPPRGAVAHARAQMSSSHSSAYLRASNQRIARGGGGRTGYLDAAARHPRSSSRSTHCIARVGAHEWSDPTRSHARPIDHLCGSRRSARPCICWGRGSSRSALRGAGARPLRADCADAACSAPHRASCLRTGLQLPTARAAATARGGGAAAAARSHLPSSLDEPQQRHAPTAVPMLPPSVAVHVAASLLLALLLASARALLRKPHRLLDAAASPLDVAA